MNSKQMKHFTLPLFFFIFVVSLQASSLAIIDKKSIQFDGEYGTAFKIKATTFEKSTHEMTLDWKVDGFLSSTAKSNVKTSLGKKEELLGLNFKLATQVNSICLIIKNSHNDIVILNEINKRLAAVIPRGAYIQPEALYLDKVEGDLLTISYNPHFRGIYINYKIRLLPDNEFKFTSS